MNILLIILLIIVAIIALLFIVALFSKKQYAVERTVVIQRPKHEVFNYITRLKNQDNYSKWVMMDPLMKKTYRGEDGSKGFVYAWNGNNKAGAGEQEIKKLEEGRRMETEVRFVRPFKGTAFNYFETHDVKENSTRLSWGFSSRLRYPANIFLLLTSIERTLGKDIEQSLQKLKSILEHH